MNNVNETVRDFAFYRMMIFNVPLTVLGIALAVGIVLVILTCVGNFCCCCLISLCAVRLFFNGLRDLMLRMTQFLLFEFEHIKKGNEQIYLLYGVRVSVYALNFLFVLLLGIIFASLISFWNAFLTEATLDECDPHADCFEVSRSSGVSLSKDRITDCDSFTIDERTTTVCFRMAYKYSEALGEAGGFLFSMQVITNIFIYIVVRTVRVVLKITKILVYKCITNPDNQKMSSKIKCVSLFAKLLGMLIVQTAYVGILIVVPLQFVVLRSDFRQTLVTPQRALQLALYTYTICLLFLVPFFVGVFVQGYEVYDSMNIDNYMNGRKSKAQTEDPEVGYNEDIPPQYH